MARDNVLAVQKNYTLRAVNFKVIGELMAFQIACIREMGGGHVTSSGSVKLRITITMPGIMETFVRLSALRRESLARALLKRVWS